MEIIRKFAGKLQRKFATDSEKKYVAELNFWTGEIENYKNWYNGELKESYGTISPSEKQKIKAGNLKDSSILTWHKFHQEKKYLLDLQLPANIFEGMKLLDIGSGPIPSATCYTNAELYCLEPLLSRYLDIGFPLHYYGNTKFIQCKAESMPMEDQYFDAIISVNALDHVDDFEKTANEIQRVLKPGGKVVFHLHYHYKTETEPVELNDERVQNAFSNINNFTKITEKKEKYGSVCEAGESFTLWSNIPADTFK